MPTRAQQAREYRKFVDAFRRTWNSPKFKAQME